MRRVVVTGLGAVTPVGNTAPETWRAAVAGESGIDWIRAFDADGLPVRVAAEVKDFDPAGLAHPKELRRLDRNVVLALGAAKSLHRNTARNLAPVPQSDRLIRAFDAGGLPARRRRGRDSTRPGSRTRRSCAGSTATSCSRSARPRRRSPTRA